MASPELEIQSNVTITLKDKYNRTIRTSKIHNKATETMVDGLLKFLKGDFINSPEEFDKFVPTNLRFGCIGLNINKDDRTLIPYDNFALNYKAMSAPSFTETQLQDTNTWKEYYNTTKNFITFDTSSGGKVSITPVDNVNSYKSLRIKIYIPAGKLLQKSLKQEGEIDTFNNYYSWVFNSGGTPSTLITEIGLFSNDNALLARVLFDGKLFLDGNQPVFDDDRNIYNPLYLTTTTSTIIEWVLGLTSKGSQDDYIVVKPSNRTNTDIGDPSTDINRDLYEYSILYFDELKSTTNNMYYTELSFTRTDNSGIPINYTFDEIGGGFVILGSRINSLTMNPVISDNKPSSLAYNQYWIDTSVTPVRLYLGHDIKDTTGKPETTQLITDTFAGVSNSGYKYYLSAVPSSDFKVYIDELEIPTSSISLITSDETNPYFTINGSAPETNAKVQAKYQYSTAINSYNTLIVKFKPKVYSNN